MIVNYYEPGINFELKPKEAIDYFSAKGLKGSFNWYELINQQHDYAFTVAKMLDLDLLATVRSALDDALANGKTLDDFKRELIPILQKKGWWGRRDIIDPQTGQIVTAQLGSASRLETIFRTNLQSSYAAGQWEGIVAGADEMPYLLYDAVDDYRTRDDHRALNGRVYPIEHKFWLNYYPPNGWNCRCGVIQLTADEVKQYGLKVGGDIPGPSSSWTNPITGEKMKIPFGIDPGFVHNSGISYLQKVQQLADEKIQKYAPDSQPAAKKGMKATQDKAQQVKAAQEAIQEEKAASEAIQKAKVEASALAELEKIATGQAEKQAALKQKILAKANATGLSAELSPPDLLAYVVTQAAQEQAKKEIASTLTGYKKQVLAGKLPTKKQQQVFDSLDDAAKAKVIAEIDKKKAEAEAAKESAAEQEIANIEPAAPTLSMANMKQIGGQGGSNPGGLYYDETTGIKWYIKEPVSDAIARNELLTAKLYEAAGVEVPEIQLIRDNGRTLLASRIVDGLEKDGPALKAGKVAGVQDSFVVDAWLANWDVVGLVYDNMLVKAGRAVRLDTGGGLLFRAQGSPKGQNFTDTVGEIESLRNAQINPSAAAVFKHATREDLIAGARKVLAMTDEKIASLVDRYGPGGAIEKTELIAKLIARREDIRKQFPEADKNTAAPEIPKSRILPEEAKRITESRVNGYSILTDKDQIEDHSVVITEYTDAKGQQRTKAWLRLREGFREEFDAKVTASKQAEIVLFNPDPLYSAELELAKGINNQLNTGQELRQKDLDRLNKLSAELISAKAKLQKIDSPEAAAQLAKVDQLFDYVEKYFADAQVGKIPPRAWRNVEKDFFSEITKKPDTDNRWIQKFEGYEVASFEKSNAKMTGLKHEIRGIRSWYIDDRDGIKTRYLNKKDNAYGIEGYIEISAAGTGPEVVEKLFRRLEEYNIDTSRTTAADRESLYLDKIAKLRLVARPAKYTEYRKLQTIQEKIAFLEDDAGWQFSKSPEYNPGGFRQAFEHGRVLFGRPDIKMEDWRPFEKKFRLYHNPVGLGIGFEKAGAGETFMNIIRGGGQMSSVADRLRRGVKSRQESVERDLETGGANYIFTRILSATRVKNTAGFWWKASNLRRADSISYDWDYFGEVRDEFQERKRLHTIEKFVEVSKVNRNETIFKDGLSFFDDLDRVVFPTQQEAEWVIAELKKEGYNKWPDGRELYEVIRYKGQD